MFRRKILLAATSLGLALTGIVMFDNGQHSAKAMFTNAEDQTQPMQTTAPFKRSLQPDYLPRVSYQAAMENSTEDTSSTPETATPPQETAATTPDTTR